MAQGYKPFPCLKCQYGKWIPSKIMKACVFDCGYQGGGCVVRFGTTKKQEDQEDKELREGE